MHRGVLLLPWMTLVALAPWANADDEVPSDSQPRMTRSALVLSHSGPPIQAETSASTLGMVDQEPGVQPAPYIAQRPDPDAPQDSSGPLVDPAATPGVFDSPVEAFHDFPNPFAPAPAVSSGNWLRNCCWYTEQSAVYMTRTVNVSNGVRLAAEFLPFFNAIGPTLNVDLDPGFEPGLRSTVGRYLGRDARNRTHAVEFTFLGLTHWRVGESLTAGTIGNIFQAIDPLLIVPVYSNSDVQTFDLTSDFNSYEFNYRIERRLGRDRIVYSRDSDWVRQAAPTLLCSAFAGIRTVIINERIDWSATNQLGNGQYIVATHNNMVGPQVGGELFYERAYWRAGLRANAGALVNWVSQSSTVRILQPDGQPLQPNRDEFAKDHTLSFAGGVSFIGEYRFRPTFGLRFSYDFMWASNLALAQNQLTFFPSTPTEISGSHMLFFQGVTLGLEWFR